MSGQMWGEVPGNWLQQLLVDSQTLADFLDSCTVRMARGLSSGEDHTWCTISLTRLKRADTLACSDPHARRIDDIQFSFGDSPCLEAARRQEPVYIRDTRDDSGRPGCSPALAAFGVRSVLAVAYDLDEGTHAIMTIYADQPDRHDPAAMPEFETHVSAIHVVLRLAARMARLRDAEADLKAALRSRTVVDLAVGIIMGQNRCSQESAVQILKEASNHRNVKLRELAAQLVLKVGAGPVTTYFDD